MLAVELADRMGGDLGLESVDAITDEIAAVAPAYAGITAAAIASAAGFDGIIAGAPDASTVEAPPAPLRHTPVVTSHDVPAVDAYSLRLVAAHKLYDDGTLTQQSPSLAPLAGGTAIRVNPTDLERLGLTHGDAVKVTSSRTTLTLAAEADGAVPKGVALLVFDQAGPGAADLLDSASPVTDVRVETL
jgi:predicted molibdopterin-dependent oxidoreductase YjgC